MHLFFGTCRREHESVCRADNPGRGAVLDVEVSRLKARPVKQPQNYYYDEQKGSPNALDNSVIMLHQANGAK